MNQPNRLLAALIFCVCITLSACGGGGSSTSYTSTTAAAPAATSNTASGSATSVSPAFTLSGVVTGDPAVTVTTTGTAAASTSTDSSGNFGFASLAPGSFTVTPTQSGHVFTPVSRAETITTASITDVVFEAATSTAATYTISGTVTGSVISGVTVTLNGMNVGSAVTDLGGNYTFAGLVSGTYTVDASFDGTTFSTPLVITLGNTDSTGNNFTSSAQVTGGIAFSAVTTLPQATVGTPYSGAVVNAITGGTAPYRYQSGTLDDGTPPLGMIVNPNGNVTGTATVPGLYEFTVCAVDAAGETSTCEPTSLTVVAAPVTTPTPPSSTPTPAATVTISASPASTNAGAASTLKWSSTNAVTCTASGGWSGTKPTSGTATVSPTSSTTYTLSCAGTGGAGKASVLVTVIPSTPAAPTVSLSASAATITTGGKSTLKWSSKNASVCAGSGGWSGNQGTSGSLSVSPASTTTYSLSCTGSSGKAEASTKVTVTAATAPQPTPAPTVSLSASPATITTGNSSTLTWTSKNADSCTAGNGWSGAKSESGNSNVSPTATTTYTLSCSGAGGTTQASAKVTVNAVATAPTPPASGTSWVYYNGSFDWPGDFNFAAVGDYADTSGGPLSGAHDIKMTSSPYGGWLPYAQNWDFNSAPYTKLTFALKPTRSGQSWQVYFVKVGDIPVGISVDVSKYGPTPVAGQWATYTVPLSVLGVLGQPIYKFAIQDQSGAGGNVWYIDNVGFVP